MACRCFVPSLRSECDSFFSSVMECDNTHKRDGLMAKLGQSRPNSFDSPDYPWHRRIVWVSMVFPSSFLLWLSPLTGVPERLTEVLVPEKMWCRWWCRHRISGLFVVDGPRFWLPRIFPRWGSSSEGVLVWLRYYLFLETFGFKKNVQNLNFTKSQNSRATI